MNQYIPDIGEREEYEVRTKQCICGELIPINEYVCPDCWGDIEKEGEDVD